MIYSLREPEAGTVGIAPAEAEQIQEQGERLYNERLRAVLEPHHVGEFLMIEPDSGQHFLNKDPVAAFREACSAIPDKRFYRLRVGYESEYAIGTRLRRRK